MRRFTLLFSALFFCFISGAQNPIYTKIKDLLFSEHPELSLEGKIIAYNTWSLEDPESRERNKSFDDACGIYKVAKLKGGIKGLVVVSIHLDGSSATASTTLYHDGVRNEILIDGNKLKKEMQGAPTNMVFDSSGQEIYRNLQTKTVATSINQLITR